MRIILLGIFFICLNTFTGSTFDTLTKYSGINNYMWYHYYSVGGTVAILSFLIFLFFQDGIKKNIILKKKEFYYLPIFRGIYFIAVLIIIFYSLKNIPINIFTILLMTTPFFLLIFAKFILKEKLNMISWIAIIIGFCGVLIVMRPNTSNFNLYIFLALFVAVSNALNFTLVSKYSHIASSYGFTFYQYIPLTIFSYIFFLYDPIFPTLKEFILFASSGLILMISMWAFNTAYHVAGKYSSIISPFIFTQIIWGSLYGVIFFSEKITALTIIGIIVIVISGTIAIYNRNK
tara:strand:+ start:320 stop:1189 length:870 start_codon:yes stop_codon:yes gene_type:complete